MTVCCGQSRIGQQSTGLLQLNGSRLLPRTDKKRESKRNPSGETRCRCAVHSVRRRCGQARTGQQSTGLLQLNDSRLLPRTNKKRESKSNPSGETRCRCAVHSVRSRCGQARIGQQSTGLLQLNGSRLLPRTNKKRESKSSPFSYWSEWRDSNSRHPGPKPGALPAGPHPEISSYCCARILNIYYTPVSEKKQP